MRKVLIPLRSVALFDATGCPIPPSARHAEEP
jgi:hypothetical protein